MEALILAGGKGERLGDAARGRPKPLVDVGGRPLLAYAVARFVAAGVQRVIVSCAAGSERLFERELAGLGADVVAVGEPEPLGRGGGLRLAASACAGRGPVFAANGDELLDVDLEALLSSHRRGGGAATIVVVPLPSPFGVVELAPDDRVLGFREAPRLPHWVNAGLYVLDSEALALLPERGDHETSTFPALAAAGRLLAHRHEGVWLTVNTPKDLRRARDFVTRHPDWAGERVAAAS
ncbi:MAG: nucleotidyltransferase family protein [Thermoleophilia bacterium]|nr:nucleotidyltransferase family protein [Thermoleophilia bacterium]